MLGNVFLGTTADVFAFGLGAQPGIVVLGSLQFELAELLLDTRQGVGVLFGSLRRDGFLDGFVTQRGFLGGFVVRHAGFSQKSVSVSEGDLPAFKGFRQIFLSGETAAGHTAACYDYRMNFSCVS